MQKPKPKRLDKLERIPWPVFVRQFLRAFEQGEHVLTLAQNGSGKTFLNRALLLNVLNLGAYETILWTKPRDKELDSFYRNAAAPKIIIKDSEYNFKRPKQRAIFVRPQAEDMRGLRASQQDVFSNVLDKLWKNGDWFLYIDELRYIVQQLGLSEQIQISYTQMRSSGVTIFATMQRPAWATVEALTESKHVFIGPITGKDDRTTVVKTYGETIAQNAADLRKREFIYVGTTFSAIVKVS